MGIPAIGIVAVLLANVTFVAWVTPPGQLVHHLSFTLVFPYSDVKEFVAHVANDTNAQFTCACP